MKKIPCQKANVLHDNIFTPFLHRYSTILFSEKPRKKPTAHYHK